ncbi:MAG: MFS transporter [Promethearchaeota archaeon]|jgi:DHA1 family multidrug resistance protein-like MFS transporter
MLSPLKRFKKQSVPHTHKYTPDFNSVIYIVIWNSLGFFFIEFIITYLIKQELNKSSTQLGLFFSFITLGGLLSSFFVGYLTDHISKRNLVMIGAFGRGLSYFGLYISIILKSLGGMYISAFLLGTGAMLFWVPLDTLISEKSSKYYRSSAFGKRRFALGIGMVLGTVFGFSVFLIGRFFIPDNMFLIYISIPLFGVANFYAGIQFSRKVDELVKFQYPNEEDVTEEDDPSKKGSQKHTRIYIFGLIMLFFALILGAMNAGLYRPFIQPFILENVNSNAGLVAWFYLPSFLIGTLVAPKLGNIGDKINPYLAISVASLLGGLVTWMIMITRNLWVFSVLLVIDNTIMLTSGFIFMNFLSRVSEKHRGKIFGITTTFDSLGMIIGPILGGIVWDVLNSTAPFVITIMVEWFLIPFFIVGIWILNPRVVELLEEKKSK